MTESTHLVKQFAVTMEISPLQFEKIGEFMRQVLKEQLDRETESIGMAITDVRHRQDFVTHISEEGMPYEVVRLACIASGYLTAESAEQTLRKIEIANAQSEWLDEDE